MVIRHSADQMTPVERLEAIRSGQPFDRFPVTPFIGNMRCFLCGASEEEIWQSAELMAKAEILAYERFGFDRLSIGPNTRGISDALCLQFGEEEKRWPVKDIYEKMNSMEPVNAADNKEIKRFLEAGAILVKQAGEIVPIEMSIGGPFTIASFLRGIELLLRDCRKNPEKVHELMEMILKSQKSCVDEIAKLGVGVAMADPVASPVLIGPKVYEEFIFPYTKELTEYVYEKTGKKVSLHMCGDTRKVWKYFIQYPLNEISLDNVIDLDEAAQLLGEHLTIAGNVDPVQSLMKGTKQDIFEDVKNCLEKGSKSVKGFSLTTGCDTPDGTAIEKMELFMEAARLYGKR